MTQTSHVPYRVPKWPKVIMVAVLWYVAIMAACTFHSRVAAFQRQLDEDTAAMNRSTAALSRSTEALKQESKP